jgi:dTDP-4-dehydrorhamnose reductase
MKNNVKNNKKEKVFAVTGYRGRLGSTLVNMGYLPIDVDVSHPKEVKEVLNDINPDVLINCASFTDVDDCELNSLLKLNQVNGIAVGVIRNCFSGKLIQISTDYVFNGKSGPYSENSPPDPLNHYGLSKLLGEELLREFDFPTDTIIRTTILYGSGVRDKPDFVTKVLSQLEKNNPVELPVFIKGNPTYIPHLALAIHHIAKMINPPKIVNVSGKEVLSRHEFGLAIANEFGYNTNLISPTRSVPGIANRPKKAGLKTELAEKLGIPIFSVYSGLKEMGEIWRSIQNTA